MRTSRFTDEQIIGIVREYEAGAKLTELCRRHNVSPTTFYKWRAKYGGMAVSDAKRLRALEEENRRLKQLLAETMLDNQALKGLLAKTGDACGAAAGGGDRPGGAGALSSSCLQAGRHLTLRGRARAEARSRS
jgi:putative transposase